MTRLAAVLWLAAAASAASPVPAAPPSAAPDDVRPPATATPAPEPSPSSAPPQPSPSPAAAYRVGPGDVLEIVVFGNDDLARTATVQNDGSIAFPLLGDLAVAGLTVEEVKDRLTRDLGDKYLVNPQVDVQVREYKSQFVSVLGEVNAPGRKPLRGGTRLIDVLLDAGGLRPTASGEVLVARPGGFEDGQLTRRLKLTRSALGPEEQVLLEAVLRTGDIITVLPKYYVTVHGEVVRPNRYQIDSELTVTGALSLAGGRTRYGSNKVEVLRRTPDGKGERLEVDLGAVREGRVPDLVLQPEDVVTVPRRFL